MRVLFTVQRDRQHLFPLVPLAWACRAAGHEVRIAGPPVLQDVIVHTGLPAMVVGRDQPLPTGTADIKMAFQHKPLPVNWGHTAVRRAEVRTAGLAVSGELARRWRVVERYLCDWIGPCARATTGDIACENGTTGAEAKVDLEGLAIVSKWPDRRWVWRSRTEGGKQRHFTSATA
jgi:hypothetical protein